MPPREAPLVTPAGRVWAERAAANAVTSAASGTYRRIMVLGIRLEWTDPDVAVADRVAVILQRDRSFRGRRCVGIDLLVRGRPPERVVGVHDDAVVQDGDGGGRVERLPLEAGPAERDVVRLPFAGWARRVDERRELPVHRGGLSVGIGRVLVAVEHLDFEQAEQVDAAVAAPLAVPLHH